MSFVRRDFIGRKLCADFSTFVFCVLFIERLDKQIKSCEFISADELITTMAFSHSDGERVQSSDLSDKTAKIAISYQRKLDRINEELVMPMIKRKEALEEEILFFQDSVNHLPEDILEMSQAIFLDGMTWEEAESCFYTNSWGIRNCRKRAIDCLVRSYQIRASQTEAFLLS